MGRAASGRHGSSEGKRHCSGGKVPQGLHEGTRCEIDVHSDDLFSAGAAVPRTNSGQESSAHAASAFAGIEGSRRIVWKNQHFFQKLLSFVGVKSQLLGIHFSTFLHFFV